MLTTQDLNLRPIETKDAAFLQELMNTPKWLQFIGDRNIHSLIDAQNYIKAKMHTELSVKGFVNFVMTEKTSGKPVGTCSIHQREGMDTMDIGYALLPDFEGKGYVSQGAKKMINCVFNQYQQAQVSAITLDENIGSCKVLEKLGFRFGGYIHLPMSEEELKWYVLDRELSISSMERDG